MESRQTLLLQRCALCKFHVLEGQNASTHSTFNLIASCNKHPNIQSHKATKIYTLTPLTYDIFFQNSSKRWAKVIEMTFSQMSTVILINDDNLTRVMWVTFDHSTVYGLQLFGTCLANSWGRVVMGMTTIRA